MQCRQKNAQKSYVSKEKAGLRVKLSGQKIFVKANVKEINMTDILPKFTPAFLCPKCGSDKCSTRLEQTQEVQADLARRKRLAWPMGELMVQTCQICGHVRISRPLDYQESQSDGQV